MRLGGGVAAACLVLSPVAARAQSAVAGCAIEGTVIDQGSGGIPSAAVSAISVATHQRWDTTTNPDGRFRLLALPVGAYELHVNMDGFRPVKRDIVLTLGQTVDLQVQLVLANVTESVTVSVPVPSIDLVRTQAAELVTPREVQNLPLNGRNYLDLALLTPGVSRTNTGASQRFAETSAVPGTDVSIASQRNLNNSFIVDGLSANDDAAGLAGTFFSQEVIREFQVITGGAVAEFGRASSGIINIVTQSGTNDTRGAAYGFFRNNRLDARNPLSNANDPLSQQQFGATVGGPVSRDRTFFFGNAEWTRNRRTGLVTIDPAAASAINAAMETAVGPTPVATGRFSTGFDSANAFVRLDTQVSPSTHGSLRYTAYHVGSANARSVGGLSAPSRGTSLDDLDQTLAFSAASTIGSSVLHEVRAQVTRSRLEAPVNDPIGPSVTIAGVASLGTSTVAPTARALDVYEAADTLTWQHGAHLIKAGADVLDNHVGIDFPGALQGAYTFSSLESLLAGRYVTYQQAFGPASQPQRNPNLAVFLQDEWRAGQTVTVNAGLRYDVQWLPRPIQTDVNNLSPRLGIAWAPGHRGTVVRASGGVFFDRVPLRATSNALQRDGSKYRVAVLPFGSPGAPVFPAALAQFPAGLLTSVTTMDPRIEGASSRQLALSVERLLGHGASAEAGYQHVTGRGLIMSRNVNAPTVSAADATARNIDNLGRPDPRFANISRFESIGRSAYDGLTVSIRSQNALGDARIAYTLSRASDDAGNFFFSQPQDASNVRADWGPSDNDQRHRLTLSGSLRSGDDAPAWGRHWRVSGIFAYSSALPFNPLTGTDRNHDTTVNDRPEGMGRNSFRSFDSATLDLRISRILAAGGADIELTLDAFNALNRTNFTLPNATYGSGAAPLPAFGQPTAAADPRQVQAGIRVRW